LLIDDDRSFLDAIAELLRFSGYKPLSANSGEEGLAVLDSQPSEISLVLLDVRMPGMDGHDTLDRIVRSHPDIPVIMLTGENSIELVVRALKSGATNSIY